ncbi:MAG: hypothetical protein RSE00_04765 [Clostridia bacterium]
MKEYIILRLRLKDGISKRNFHSKFNVDILDIFGVEIKQLEDLGLIYILKEKFDTNISLTKRGQEVANIVFEKFV